MAIDYVIEALKGAKELADFAKIEASGRRAARRERNIQELIEALRLIYFSPRGVIKLLEEIVQGRIPTEQQIAMILPNFNDHEFNVHRMLRRLDPDDGHIQGALTLRAERVLREISYGKSGVRSKVKDLLNEALTLGTPVSEHDAIALLNEIRALNQAIESAEEALVSSTK